MERAKIWYQQCDLVLDYADMRMYNPRFDLNFYKGNKDNTENLISMIIVSSRDST